MTRRWLRVGGLWLAQSRPRSVAGPRGVATKSVAPSTAGSSIGRAGVSAFCRRSRALLMEIRCADEARSSTCCSSGAAAETTTAAAGDARSVRVSPLSSNPRHADGPPDSGLSSDEASATSRLCRATRAAGCAERAAAASSSTIDAILLVGLASLWAGCFFISLLSPFGAGDVTRMDQWQQQLDEATGRTYIYNIVTGVSQWCGGRVAPGRSDSPRAGP